MAPNEKRGVQAGWLTLTLLSVITGASYLTAQVVDATAYPDLRLRSTSISAQLVECAVIACVSACLMWPLVLRPLRRQTIAARNEAAEREAALLADRNTQDFHARLHRALEMATVEDDAYAVAKRAMGVLVPETTAHLMLADSSEAHLKLAIEASSAAGVGGCGVVAPHDCPAIRKGQTALYPDDRELDACPWLVGRTTAPTSAVCIPVSTIGRSIGVLHVAGPPAHLPTLATIAKLEAVAEQVGGRLGTLRVMEKTHLQAATDPLTGLLNRRSLENQAQQLIRGSVPFALAMGDLDHFKKLNDTHGHDAGDRALRQFARVMQTVLRSEDIVSRFGGEEFVVVFPGLSAAAASAALRRVQEQLLVNVAGGAIAPVTVTFGVAESIDAMSLEELIRLADLSLFAGKREGRNQIVSHVAAQAPRVDGRSGARSDPPG
jgi:diguanylate cyclase (GGDEF)-like protein